PQIHFSIAQPLSYRHLSTPDYENVNNRDVPISASGKTPGEGSKKQECEHGILQKPKVPKKLHHLLGSYSVSATGFSQCFRLPCHLERTLSLFLYSLLPNQSTPFPLLRFRTRQWEQVIGGAQHEERRPALRTAKRRSHNKPDSADRLRPMAFPVWGSSSKSNIQGVVVSAALFHVCVDGSGSGRISLQDYNVARTAMPYHDSYSHLISRPYQEQDVSCPTCPRSFDRKASNPLSFACSTTRLTPHKPFCSAPKPGRDPGYPTKFGPQAT
ncbi:hypothetical protein CPAR01_05976, partial [Colletotrichum paranaense]